MMKWKIIDNSKRIQPPEGTYIEWKDQIAKDCHEQCVYCAISERSWGGRRNFHIDHFRPKSKFKELTNVITNLYYSCSICNTYKNNDWQGDPTSCDNICYPDPSIFNYSEIFDINLATFRIVGRNLAAIYLITRLNLNRNQLLFERKEDYLNSIFIEMIKKTKYIICNNDINEESKRRLYIVLANVGELLARRNEVLPYKNADIVKNE